MADEDLLLIFMGLIHWPLRFWVAAEASRRFVDERSNNTFEFLLTTTLTERQIIRGQWRSLWHQFAGPVAAVLVWEGCFVVYIQRHSAAMWSIGPVILTQMMISFVVDLVALGWVGLWFGLRLRGRIKAILGSLVLVLGVPWLLYLVFFVLENTAQIRFETQTFIRLGFGVAVNLPAIFWIKSRLPERVRGLATQG